MSKMWVLVVFASILVVGSCSPECVEWNNYTDYFVQYSNQQSVDDPTIGVADIHPNLPLQLGLFLAVDATEGTLGNRSTLARRFNATKCSKVCNETLSSFFEYKDLELHFGKVRTKFLYVISYESNIRIRVNANSFRFGITKTCSDCYLNWLEVQDFQDLDVSVESSDWWFQWFMSPLLQYGFTNYNKAFIIKLINDQVEDLFKPFITTYCQFD